MAFYSFAAVSPKIFFKEYFKEARLTGWLVVRRGYNILKFTGLEYKDTSEDNTIAQL